MNTSENSDPQLPQEVWAHVQRLVGDNYSFDVTVDSHLRNWGEEILPALAHLLTAEALTVDEVLACSSHTSLQSLVTDPHARGERLIAKAVAMVEKGQLEQSQLSEVSSYRELNELVGGDADT